MGRLTRGSMILAALALLAPASALGAAKTFKVTSTTDTIPNGCTKSNCTLREAVIAANGHAGTDTVLVKGGKNYALALPATGEDLAADGDLDVTSPLSVRATGKKRAIIDAAATSTEPVFTSFSPLRLQGLNLLHGFYGVVANDAGLVLKDTGVNHNTKDGAVQSGPGSLKATTSEFVLNGLVGVAERGPGGIKLNDVGSTGNGEVGVEEEDAGGINVRRSKINSNDSYGLEENSGGGITMDRSTADDNGNYGVAEFDGGSLVATSSSASHNGSYGFEETSDGNLTLKSSHGDSNGAYGATEFDAGNLTFKGGSASHNASYGIEETSDGNMVAANVHADHNGNYGITEFDAGDLKLNHATANAAGSYGVEETSTGALIAKRVTVNNSGSYGITEFDDGPMKLTRAHVSGTQGDYGIETTGDGALSVSRSKVTGTKGSGIADFSGVNGTISRTVMSGNFTGFQKSGGGEDTITASSITGNNWTGDGAGMFLSTAAAKLVRTTVSGNHADGNGGGIFLKFAILELIDSTVARNSANGSSGGIADGFSSFVQSNGSTIARNAGDADNSGGGATGGGITLYGGGTASMANTLLAMNTIGAGVGPDCNAAVPVTSGGHNLLGSPTACTGFTGPGDLIKPQPKIGQLADNGGPTKTIALRKGSPAIGKAGNDAPKTDQRGRKRDKHPDIGAFERLP